MARRKGTPDASSEEPEDKAKDDKTEATSSAGEAKDTPEAKPNPDDVETQPLRPESPRVTDPRGSAVRPEPEELPAIEPPPPKTEPWPDATPPPMKPVEGPRERPTETIAMSPLAIGKPPDMPRTSAPPPLALGDVENPTHMPGPKEVPSGSPDDPAPAPGLVPPGDSRSLRRGNEFALIYRVGTCVVTRIGTLGTRGQWRVVEYPTYAFASNSYAKECSRLVSEGFSDYRE